MRNLITALLPIVLIAGQVHGQVGQLDQSFNPEDTGYGLGEGPNGWIDAGAIQADGKIILAGSFTTFNGVPTSTVVRLNGDGTLDTEFVPQQAGYVRAKAVALQADGKILLGGEFNTYAGTPCSGLVRLNIDGTLDEDFTLGTPWPQFSSSYIEEIVVQPDGKILLGGQFYTYNAMSFSGLARLDQDGTLDTQFDPGSGVETQDGSSGAVNAILLHDDGRIDIGGFFSIYDGQPRSGVARIHANGTIDTSFNPGAGAAAVTTLAALPDGGLVVGGMFATFQGSAHGSIVRLESNGTVSSAFSAGAGISHSDYPRIRSLVRRADGTLLIGGLFDHVDGQLRSNLALLESDGSLAPLFDASMGTNYEVLGLAVMPGGGVLALGMLGSAAGMGRRGYAAYHSDGTLNMNLGSSSMGANGTVSSISKGPDGRLLVAGSFGAYNGIPSNGVARITPSGALDETFDAYDSLNVYPFKIAVQPDGKPLIAGSTYASGWSVLKRLNMDGTIDPSYPLWNGLSLVNPPWISTMYLQPDGKLLLAGSFYNPSSNSSNHLVRLNMDGSLDSGFTLTDSYASIFAIAVQEDGKILVGGGIETWAGPASNLVRLHPDGTRDMSFDPGTALWSDYGGVQQLALHTDGRILVGGDFNTAHGIRCLMPDGSVDPLFTIGSGFSIATTTTMLSISSLIPQADGRILMTGMFDSFNGTPTPGIVRLHADGSLDITFNPGTGPSEQIRCAALQANGDLIIGGDFHAYDGIGRNHLARVRGTDGNGITDRAVAASTLVIHADGECNTLTIHSTRTSLMPGVLSIRNVQGQLVQTSQTPIASSSYTIPLAPLATGVYTVELRCGAFIQTARFINEN